MRDTTMKMTKLFEKKLKALVDKMGLYTNFDWDLGWFDFISKNYIKLGCVRFYRYGNEHQAAVTDLCSNCIHKNLLLRKRLKMEWL